MIVSIQIMLADVAPRRRAKAGMKKVTGIERKKSTVGSNAFHKYLLILRKKLSNTPSKIDNKVLNTIGASLSFKEQVN